MKKPDHDGVGPLTFWFLAGILSTLLAAALLANLQDYCR